MIIPTEKEGVMEMREKLFELIDQYYSDPRIQTLEDHLIANGVTIQKWIPVTERLPSFELVEAKTYDMDVYPCLCVVLNPRARNGKYVSKLYYDGYLFLNADMCDFTNEVTHWMPLPEPPSGERRTDDERTG